MSNGSKSTNPFPGLRAFRQDEDYLFFGREEQTIELLRRLGGNRFVTVVGTSGSGKSSLVRCGLLSELLGGKMLQAGAAWEVAVTHPGGNPLAILTDALLEAELYDGEVESVRENLLATLSRSHFGLVEAVRQAGIGKDTNFLLVVDQFEEIFRFREAGQTQQEAAAEFVSLLLQTVAQQEVPIYVVLTMRSDFIGECSQFEGLSEMVNQGEFLIPRLTREQYKRVIEGPVKVAGGKIAPRLLQRLLNDLGQQADQLPCLQHALMRTWDVWAEAGETGALDLDDYRRVGGMAEALSLHADEVYQALGSDQEREWCRGLFEALTVKESENRGIRRPQRLSSLCEILEVPADQLVPIMDAFRRQGVTFLMPSPEVDLDGNTIIDISHESLMRVWTRLRHWVEEEAQAAGIYVRLAESATLHAEGKAGLYRDPELGIALSWIDRARHPNQAWAERYRHGFPEAMAFLEASKEAAEAGEREKEAARQREVSQAKALAEAERLRAEEQRKGARRLRKLLAAAAVIALIAIGASIFAALQTGKARKSEAAADALSAQLKTSLVQGDFNNSFEKLNSGAAAASLAYLARATRTNPGYAPAGMRALSTLTSGRLPVQRFAPIEHKKPIEFFLHNKKHDLLLTSSEGGREVRLWSMETGLPWKPLEGSSGEEWRSTEAGPAPAAVLAGIKEKFAGARRIWLASDPGEPPTDPRYFRKAIPIPAGRIPVRADLFLLVDNSFELSVNGTMVGSGKDYQGTYHIGISGTALADGLELFIVARNSEKGAYVEVVAVITFEGGDPLVVTTDASWQSSTAEGTGFADSKDFGPTKDGGSRIEELSAPALDQLQWSADEDRLVGRDAGKGQIVGWDVATGKRTGKPVKLKGMKDVKISPFHEAGDLAGCSYADGSVQVWNLKTGEAATPPLKTGGNITQWSFTPDGKRVIGLFSDAVITVWDVSGGAEVARVSTRPVRPTRFSVSQDGRYVLTSDESKKQVAWWEIGAAGGPSELAWIELPFVANDMRFLASGDVVSFIGTGDKGTVRARSFALTGDRKQVADITSNPNATPMAGMGDRSRGSHGIVGAMTANLVTLWDLQTGEPFPRPLIAPELLASANLSPDGRRLIAGSATQGVTASASAADKKLFVFDVFSGQLVFPRPIVLESSSRITFSPDGETLVTMDFSAKRTAFWDLRTGRDVRAPIPGDARSVVFSRSGKRVALYQYVRVERGTQDLGQTTGRFFLHETGFSPAAPEYLAERSQRNSFVSAPSEGGHWLTYDWPSVSPAPRLQVWDAQKSTSVQTIQLNVDAKAMEGAVRSSVAWSADGKRMVLVNGEKSAAVVETSSGKILTELKGDAPVYVVAISRDGSSAACGTADGTVKTWSGDGATATINPFAGKDGIGQLAFNASGSLLAVAADTKRTIAVVDPRTGTPRFEPRQTVNISEDFAFTPDGRYVIVSQLDAKVPMIDLKSGEIVREFEIGDWSRGLDLNADGRILAVASGADLTATSGLAYLFDVESGKMLTPPLPHPGLVGRVQFSRDGKILATATYPAPSGFAYYQLWDVATGLPLTDPVGGRGQATSIAIQPDGSAAAVGWSNGIVQTVAIPPRTPAPAWFPELAEAVAGRRLAAETGTLENVPDAELTALRGKVLAADPVYAADAEWFRWAKWLFEAPESRTVSPGARTTLTNLMERLRAAVNREDLHQAVRLSPNDALTFARLASSYQSDSVADIGTAKRHWEDTVVWFSDRSIELAPESAEVWTMRGELMRKLGRTVLAAEAAAKVLAVAPTATGASSPNTFYQNAMALASQGKWEEAQAAYDGALGLLDDYVKQLEAGGQPLPLLGNLGRLVPTRVAAAQPDQDGAPPAISKEPIPGAFENFDAVAPGNLPPGWRVWNRTDPGGRPGVHHAGDFGTDSWKDWTVIDRAQLDWGDDPLRRRVLMENTERRKVANGAEVPLLEGRFALAMSSTRPGEQIQYLESPDFDCSGRKDVHLSFNSAWEQDDFRMGILEYSLDRGTTWKPVVYFVHKPLLDEARKKYADANKEAGAKDGFDVAAFLNEERSTFPWRLEPGVTAHRGRIGAFTVAADTPGLAACFEGRNKGTTEFKRREVRAVPGADGAATVRLRFGAVSPRHALWAIDNVGLYEGAKESKPVAAVVAGAEAEKELKRPANDPTELLRLASELAGGPKAAGSAAPNAAPLMAAAMASVTADATATAPNATPGNENKANRPATSNILESRLLIARARKLNPANRLVRIFAAMMEMAGMVTISTEDEKAALKAADPFLGRAHDQLVNSAFLAADLRDPMWRAAYSMIVALRGLIAAKNGERESGMTLIALAEATAAGGPVATMIPQILASLEGGNPAGVIAESDILLKRGSAWSYFDEGKLSDPAWMQPEFDDRRWFRGPASLGYGDKPKTPVGWGPDEKKRFITTWFRTRFDVADPGRIKALALHLLRDDGAVVYLNGKEIWRDNMPKGAITSETPAVASVVDKDEARFFDHTVEEVSLNKGANVIAVEVHQNTPRSSDLSFDLEIAGITTPKAVIGAGIPVATFAEKFKAFGIPDVIQSEFWNFRTEQYITSGDAARATEALQQAEAHDAGDKGDPRRLRLRALVAATGAKTEEAGRLYNAAMDAMVQHAAAGKTIYAAQLPAALREAALVLGQTPADLAFVLRRFANSTRTELELNLMLNWAKAKAGKDPGALAQIWFALSDGLKRDQDALTIAESVLASRPKPKAGAPAVEMRQYKEWLERQEKGLRAAGNKAAADALGSELRAVPPGNPGLSPKLIDLTDYYSGDLFRSSELYQLALSFVPLKGVSFDLRGYVQLESGTLPEGKTFNEKYSGKHPLEQKGIKVGQKSPAIHFLTSTSWGRETKGVEVARFVMHYEDGSTETMPVKFGDDVADQVVNNSDPVAPGHVGWRGFKENGNLHEISELVWKNPHPDKKITTIDFISAKAKAAPFLIGITLE